MGLIRGGLSSKQEKTEQPFVPAAGGMIIFETERINLAISHDENNSDVWIPRPLPNVTQCSKLQD